MISNVLPCLTHHVLSIWVVCLKMVYTTKITMFIAEMMLNHSIQVHHISDIWQNNALMFHLKIILVQSSSLISKPENFAYDLGKFSQFASFQWDPEIEIETQQSLLWESIPLGKWVIPPSYIIYIYIYSVCMQYSLFYMIYRCIYIYVYIYICMYVYIYICIYIYMYTYIYIYRIYIYRMK